MFVECCWLATNLCLQFMHNPIIFFFSHFWVVVIRLDNTMLTFDHVQNPSEVYPDTSMFTNYSTNVAPFQPYIAAEISADNYQESSMFLIGDNDSTSGLNDFPGLYQNGPLEAGSEYTAFVRAFVNTVPVSGLCMCVKSVWGGMCVCVSGECV